jgi:2-polyprenyl-3-methyl-5-hydroxy-6-metoxy-1,4-benzoquinol methylase
MNCPLCNESRRTVFHQWPTFAVNECSACGFRFIDTASPDYPKDAQYVYDEPGEFKVNSQQPHIQRRVRDILQFNHPPGRALDVGCGKGEVSLALAQAGFDCTGLDMKERLIRHLQRQQPTVRWMRAMTDELERMGEQFDVITLYHVLEHVSKPIECLVNLKRLLRPGGLLVLEVPNVGGWEARLKGYRWHYYKVDHVNYFRPNDLVRAAKMAGLQVVGVKGYQHFSHPQNVWWKDFVKGSLARLGFQDVISVFLRVE